MPYERFSGLLRRAKNSVAPGARPAIAIPSGVWCCAAKRPSSIPCSHKVLFEKLSPAPTPALHVAEPLADMTGRVACEDRFT